MYETWEEIEAHPLQNGMALEHFLETIDVAPAFAPSDGIVRCIDEGTPGGVHLAGSGILFENEDELIELLHQNQIKGLMSHSNCGAAKLSAKQNGWPIADADQYGAYHVQAIAQKAGLNYAGHIEIDKLTRPAHQHTAWAAYYDTTGTFNPLKVPELPLGFGITRSLHTAADQPLSEMKIATQIAFGDHGWGKKFTHKKQLLLIPIASPGFSLPMLIKELAPLKEKYRELVRIEGFTI
ncbi:hypothetical protein HYW32_02110 [Candidatus Berkelbacteria bacterium]|nr:hypothetical protein [Candidatus Berkelbacteria bacterium]